MRLIELNPRWCTGSQWTDANGTMWFPNYDKSHERKGMGMTFDCPTHQTHRLGIFFLNPIDGLPPADGQNCHWKREGDTFETISVAPSVDASPSGCWHGFIKNGEIM